MTAKELHHVTIFLMQYVPGVTWVSSDAPQGLFEFGNGQVKIENHFGTPPDQGPEAMVRELVLDWEDKTSFMVHDTVIERYFTHVDQESTEEAAG